MKALFLPIIFCGAALLTGCETVAVVDHGPSYYSPGAVYYDGGRPFYYTSGVRYWGYPHGYSGSRSYTHVDIDRDVTRNYYVDRRTVVRHGHQNYHRSHAVPTKVKVQPKQPVKKKKNRASDQA